MDRPVCLSNVQAERPAEPDRSSLEFGASNLRPTDQHRCLRWRARQSTLLLQSEFARENGTVALLDGDVLQDSASLNFM